MQTTETLMQDKIMAARAQGIQGPVRWQYGNGMIVGYLRRVQRRHQCIDMKKMCSLK